MNKTPEQKIDLNGFALIEASAGTGKTYTIQNLYLRMTAGWFDETAGQERNLGVDEILVMTYTIAATEELKERIRKILTLGVLYFENPGALNEGDFNRLDELLSESRSLLFPGQTQSDRDQLIRNRLWNALLIFDDAAIFTIHGFCQRLLARYAFESGILFNAEIRTDGDRLIGELLSDYLRAYSYPESTPFRSVLKKEPAARLSSRSQLNLTLELLNRSGLTVTGCPDRNPEDLLREMEEILEKLLAEYQPRLAGEMQLPDAESADAVLSRWKTEGDPSAAGEAELLAFAKIHDHLSTASGPDERFNRFSMLCGDLIRLRGDYLKAVPLHAARWTLEQFRNLKQQENFLSFDDLLNGVLQAVREKNNPLRELVRNQYRAAIVDEFQDTDPVQYEIFHRIFGQPETGHILFFVGDPKQAIYGFRGGDTATYRIARNFVKEHGCEYSLRRNYRSAEKLLDAVNDLFAKRPQNTDADETVFADREVEFQTVEAGKEGPGLTDSSGKEDSCPFKFCWLTASEAGEDDPFSLNDAVEHAIRACAEDIAGLLNSEWHSPDTGKTLHPNDIAVLVPDNLDAKRVRDELKKRNIPCVIPKSENVFKSAAAKYLRTMLKAVESSSDANLVSEAMLTPLLGYTLDDMIAQHASVQGTGTSDVRNAVQEKMRLLSSLWQQNSFLKMFQEMLRMFDVRVKLLKRNDGERILTDLLHLRDLIHLKISETGLSSAGVLSYLAAQENEEDSEEKETMMETDRAAVVISTIHSSKGLEYPVVMLPLMFKKTFAYQDGRAACYHDSSGQLILNFSPDPAAVELIEREKKQELMRLLYVALTRAKYSCCLYWGLIKGDSVSGLHDRTALDWLLPTVSGHQFPELKDDPIPQLEHCERRLIFTGHTPVTVWQPETGEAENLSLRKWRGRIDMDYHFTSFTALAGGHDGPDGLDYDDGDSGNRLEKPVGIFRIPAGAPTGNAWHDIMEEIDFTAFDPANEQDRNFIRMKMEIFGVLHQGMAPELRDEFVALTGQMITHLLNTPLRDADGELFSLREIPRNERLSELKFNYRFHQGVQTGQLIDALSGYVESVFGEKIAATAIRKLRISGGFLNGALDVLFRRNGKLYIADWKSNRINGWISGFSAAGLNGEMTDHAYYLQYLIYTVAVVKYLELHLHHPVSEADYDRLFGGVFYFFMRGVNCASPGQGVFTTRPPYALIRRLEQLIG